MAADEPPYLTVGTDVSAKYKGAFCEAKIKKVIRMVKCKVTFKNNLGSALVPDDQIKGVLRIGADVEAKHPEKNLFVDAVINKLQDYSQYTVVFDDGDETTLRRTSLCLKSGRHFAESPTLDQFPLTNPEHFGTPVIGSGKSKRKRRSTMNSASLDYDSSDEELHIKKSKISRVKERDPDLGKVVCVEYGDRRKKESWYPGLVVSSPLQDNFKINPKEEYLIRSFKDGKYYQVPKKDTREFTPEIGQKVESNTLRTAVEKALLYYEKEELPPHWDKALYMGLDTPSAEEESHDSDSDTSDDEPSEEKDRFVAQLYKFMDERGTPINKAPTVGSRDLNLYKLFKIMHKMGGYNRVTNQNQWKVVYTKMGLPSANPAGSNQIKTAYKRYLHSFEDFYRKLGCTMVTNSRSTRVRHRSDRNFIITRNRDRDISTPKGKASNKDNKEKSFGEKKTDDKPKSDEGKKIDVKSKGDDGKKAEMKSKGDDSKKAEVKSKGDDGKKTDVKSKGDDGKKADVKSKGDDGKKAEVKSKGDDGKKQEIKSKNEEVPKSDEKQKSTEKKKHEKPVKADEKEDKIKQKKTEEKPRLVRSQSLNKDKKEAKSCEDEKKEVKPEKARTREDARKEKAESPEKKETRSSTKIEQERERREREESEKKEVEQMKEKKERIVREKDKKDEKVVKKEEKQTKEIIEDKTEKSKDKKDEKSGNEKKDEKSAREKKEEKHVKDKKEDKSPKQKREEKVTKDKKEEKLSKDKKEERNVKDKKDTKSVKEKKDEKSPGKVLKEDKPSKAENDTKSKEKTPVKDKKETRLVKEKKAMLPKEKKEDKTVKKDDLPQKDKNEAKPPKDKKDEKDNEDSSDDVIIMDIEDDQPIKEMEEKAMKMKNDSEDNPLKQTSDAKLLVCLAEEKQGSQVKKKLIKTEEKEESKSGTQSNDSDDDDLPLALEKMIDKKDVKEGEIEIGDRVKVKYGRGRLQKVYEAKVLKIEKEGGDKRYYVHYAGWNMRYDEWVRKSSIVENMSERNRVARKKKQILNAKAQNFLTQVNLKREKGRLPGTLISSKLSRKSSTSSTNSVVSCSRTTRSDKNSLSTSPYSAGLEPRKRARKKSGISVALTDTSQDSESDMDHMSFDPDDEGDEIEDHSNHSDVHIKEEILSDAEEEKETSEKGSKISPESSITLEDTSCDFKEFKRKMSLSEEKSPPVLSSIDDHKISEDVTPEELGKETVPDIIEINDDDDIDDDVPKIDSDVMICDAEDSPRNITKKNDDEKADKENQMEQEDPNRSEGFENLKDVEPSSSSKSGKQSSNLVDSFKDLQPSSMKLLASETLTRTLNVAIKDIASEYDFHKWSEISEKKDSVKLCDTSCKDCVTSVSCTESEDEKMEASQPSPPAEVESEKEDKCLEVEETDENKDAPESSNINESGDANDDESNVEEKDTSTELESEKVSEEEEKAVISVHDGKEENVDNLSLVEHIDENSKSSSVDTSDSHDAAENISEHSMSEEKIETVDLCKYEELVVVDDSTVEKSDEESKNDDDNEIKPSDISSDNAKEPEPPTEVCSLSTEQDKCDISSDTLSAADNSAFAKETASRQRTESCGPLPTLEIPGCPTDLHDTCADLPTIDKFAEKDETTEPESLTTSYEKQESEKEEVGDDEDGCGGGSSVEEVEKLQPVSDKAEGDCGKKLKEIEEVLTIGGAEFSDVCNSESLQTSAVALAAAVATSIATAVPLPVPSPAGEEKTIPCLHENSGTTKLSEISSETLEGKKPKLPERSVEQKFVEKVFQNLEKRNKLEEENAAKRGEKNADLRNTSPLPQFLCSDSEQRQNLCSEGDSDSVLKENVSYVESDVDDDVSKVDTCEAEDLSKPKNYELNEETDVKEIKEKDTSPSKIELNLEGSRLFEQSVMKPSECSFMRRLGEVADMFLESHQASQANKDSNAIRNEGSVTSSMVKKEGKKKKAKLSKQEKKMSGVDFLDREESKCTKSKSKKKKNEHDDFDKSKDPEFKAKSKKLKKNKNKKKLSKHDDSTSDLWKKSDAKDEDNSSERVRKKDKKKREERKISKGESKTDDSWEIKVDLSKKEKKKGKKKDKLSSEKRAELLEKRAKKKKKLHLEDNFDSDSEKESRLSRKEKKREKKKVKSKDSSSSDDCSERLVKDLPFEQDENLSSFGSKLIIPDTLQRQDSSRSDDPDMSFLLCKEKVPASPEGANTIPEDTSNSSLMEENNGMTGQASSDSEKIDPIIIDSYPRHEGLEHLDIRTTHDTVLDNTPPTTPSGTESLLSSSPSHERESYALHYPESTRSGRESPEGESDSLHCEPAGIEITDSEEYRAAATLAFAVCKSVPEKPKETSRVPLKRQKSECEDLSPSKRRKKSKRHSLSESSKSLHSRHKSVSRSLRGDDEYDSSGANSVTTVTSPSHSSSFLQNTSLITASSQHLTTTQTAAAHTPSRPSKFNFFVPLDDYKDADKRIAIIQEKLSELKSTYMQLKAEVALIDRRRKKAKKKEKEAGSVSNNPSSHLEEVQCSS